MVTANKLQLQLCQLKISCNKPWVKQFFGKVVGSMPHPDACFAHYILQIISNHLAQAAAESQKMSINANSCWMVLIF